MEFITQNSTQIWTQCETPQLTSTPTARWVATLPNARRKRTRRSKLPANPAGLLAYNMLLSRIRKKSSCAAHACGGGTSTSRRALLVCYMQRCTRGPTAWRGPPKSSLAPAALHIWNADVAAPASRLLLVAPRSIGLRPPSSSRLPV